MSQKELQNLEDASDELMLADDDQPVPYPMVHALVESRYY